MRYRLFVLFALLATGARAQWLNYPTPGTPRTKDGKPDLSAKTPRLAGKPDLSGVWQVEPEAKGVIERMVGGDLTVGLVPGDEIDTFSRYFFNILADDPGPLRHTANASRTPRVYVNTTSPVRCAFHCIDG